MWIRRALPSALAAGVVLLGVPLNAVPAQADPVPAPYSGSGHADVATADVSVLSPLLGGGLVDTSLTDVTIGHARVTTDSATAPSTRAASANLDGDILGGSVTPDRVSVTAPPTASYDQDLANLAVPTLLATTGLQGSGDTRWAGNTACVTGDPLASATTRLASAVVGDLNLPVGGLGSLSDTSLTLAELGAATTRTRTELVPHGSTNDVRTTTTAHVAPVELLGGLVKVDVADATLVARSDGTTGTTTYDDPVVSLSADTDHDGTDDLTVPDVRLDSGTSLPVTLTLLDDPVAGELTATVDLTVEDDSSTSSGATASGEVPSVVSVDLAVRATGLIAGLLGTDVASASLALLPLSASATAPVGGVECQLAPPAIAQPSEGSWTFDHRPTLRGTGVPGATLHLYVDGGPSAADVTVGGDGSWSHVPSSPLSTGTHNVVATQSLDGLTSDRSSHPVFHIAERPVVTAPADGTSSYELQPVIMGTGNPGGTVKVVVDSSTIGTTTVDEHGNWKLATSEKLSCGKHRTTGEQTTGTLRESAPTVSFRVLCVDLSGGGGDLPTATYTGTTSGGTSTGALPGTGAPAGAQWLVVLGAALTAAGVALARRGLLT